MKTARRLPLIVTAGLVLAVGLLLALHGNPGAGAATFSLPRAASAVSEDFPIVQGPSDLLRPAVADGRVVVWYAEGESGLDIFGIRLASTENGQVLPQGEPFVIAGDPGDQAVPAVAASSGDGGYLAVWHSKSAPDAGFDVYARHLTAEGDPPEAPFVVSAAEGDQLRPDVAYAPAVDRYVVVWQDDRTGDDVDLRARLVGADGGLSDEFVVSSVSSDQLIPSVACETEAAQCLVVWMDDRNNSFFYTDIMGRLVDADRGEGLGGKIDVAVERWYQDSPTTIYNPVSAEYLVVWNDDISCRRVSRDGQALGAGRIDVSLESPFQWKPAVAIDDQGRYLIIWEDGRNQDSHGTDIYGQWLSADGVPSGPNFALSTDSHNQYWPALAFSADRGEFFAVWEDERGVDGNGGSIGLYGKTLPFASESQ